IPARGWKDIAWRLWAKVGEDRVLLIAAGATFYLLLALFPALAAFVSVYGFVADPATIADHISYIGGLLPSGGLEIIQGQLEALVTQNEDALSVGFLTGLAIALWSANNGIKTLFEAMNVAYGEHERRSFLKLNLVAFAFTLGAVFVAILLIVSVGVVPAIMGAFGLSSITDELIASLRWPIVFALIVMSITMIYRYGPSRNRARWGWVVGGAILTSLVWLATSIAFSWYLQNFANYGATYGSLGAVIGFMMWVWVSSVIFIVGAEINAEMEHQTALDTTDAPEKPLGERGARVADTIGKSSSKGRPAEVEKKGFFARIRSKAHKAKEAV
ncbi:MAG: YihY/virulence factor BrkB family protein, partial [Rhizobiaceae bacterium]|nr:YihY/virulence factor BrkB family protein [Rhizobiaceae bacterium]